MRTEIRKVVAAVVGGLVAWAHARWGVVVTLETQAALVVIVYAVVDRQLRRLRWIDPAAWAEDVWADRAAEVTGHLTTEVARSKIEQGEV